MPIIVLPGTLLAAFGYRLDDVRIEPQVGDLIELVTIAEDCLIVQRFSPSRKSVYQIRGRAVTAQTH